MFSKSGKTKIHPKGTIKKTKKTKKKKEPPFATVMALSEEGEGYAPQGSNIRILHDLPPNPEPVDTWLSNQRPSPFTNDPSPYEADIIRHNIERYNRQAAEQRNLSFGYPTAPEVKKGAVSWVQPINKIKYQFLQPRSQPERTDFNTMPPIHRTYTVPHNKRPRTSRTHHRLPASAAPPQDGGKKKYTNNINMKRRTRKKRGGGPGAAAADEAEPKIEWVIENTEGRINSFVNSDVPQRGDGFNNMIQQMRNRISDGGFWIVEWNEARDVHDDYNHYHLAWDDEDNEPPDLIRFPFPPRPTQAGGKKRKRKTKRKKRKKRKTKRKRRKRKKKTRRRKRTRRKRGGMDDSCANYKYKKYGNTEQKARMRDRDDVTQAAADKYCKYMNKTTPKCYTPLGKCAKIDEAGIAIAPIFTDSDIQHLPANLRRDLAQLL